MIMQEAVALHWRLNRKPMHLQNRVEVAVRASWEPYEDYGVYDSMIYIRSTVYRRPEINQTLVVRGSIVARLREGNDANP